jgi:phospholipase C
VNLRNPAGSNTLRRDFFGGGPRIPLIVVSPFSKGSRVVHTYSDHASVLKFIKLERPLSGNSCSSLQ